MLALLQGLSSGAPSAAAEAAVWASNAGAWAKRLSAHYPDYADVAQPVALAVGEMCHGLALLTAAAPPGTAGAPAAVARQQDRRLASLVAGLLAFPLPLPSPADSAGVLTAEAGDIDAAAVAAESPAALAAPAAQGLLDAVVLAGTRTRRPDLPPDRLQSICELESYTSRLAACRAALHAAAAAIRARGGAGLREHAAPLAAVFDCFVAAWQQLKDLEEKRAAEEAEVYKTKTRTNSFMTDEVRLRLNLNGN